MTDFPPCPLAQHTRCRFVNEIGYSTTMHSPIQHNREGRPVGGGANLVTRYISCLECQRRWDSAATELEDAQRQPRKWMLQR